MGKQKVVSIAQAAERLGVSNSRLRTLCIAGRIEGAFKLGDRAWVIPSPIRIFAPDDLSLSRPSKLRMRRA